MHIIVFSGHILSSLYRKTLKVGNINIALAVNIYMLVPTGFDPKVSGFSVQGFTIIPFSHCLLILDFESPYVAMPYCFLLREFFRYLLGSNFPVMPTLCIFGQLVCETI